MSRRETPTLRSYWLREVGGMLVEEFPVVERGEGVRPRWIDGVILPDEPKCIAPWGRPVPLEGEDVIVVEVKAAPLGMYLMGQTLFSADLIARHLEPRNLEAVALCGEDDDELRPLLEPEAPRANQTAALEAGHRGH